MKTIYRTQDAEAGNVIDEFDTYDEAQEAIRRYEDDDRADNTYTPNFYEIVEVMELSGGESR